MDQLTKSTLLQTLGAFQAMTPEQFAAMDDDAWQYAMDLADTCKAIASRIETLDILSPVEPMDDASRQAFVAQFDADTLNDVIPEYGTEPARL